MDAPTSRPPKSEDRIRAMLESVRREAGRKESVGPMREGLRDDEPLVIASFRDRECCRRFQETLLAAGVMSQARISRTCAEILVDRGDSQQAIELLDRHLREFPDLPPQTSRRDYDFTILGAVIGAVFGLIILVADFRTLRDVALLTAFTLLGALTGSFLDRPRNCYRATGQIQFGLGDILVLMALVALSIVLFGLLFRL